MNDKTKSNYHEGEEGVLRAEILHFPNVLHGRFKKGSPSF